MQVSGIKFSSSSSCWTMAWIALGTLKQSRARDHSRVFVRRIAIVILKVRYSPAGKGLRIQMFLTIAGRCASTSPRASIPKESQFDACHTQCHKYFISLEKLKKSVPARRARERHSLIGDFADERSNIDKICDRTVRSTVEHYCLCRFLTVVYPSKQD